MEITRKSFIGGVAALIASSVLPKAKAVSSSVHARMTATEVLASRTAYSEMELSYVEAMRKAMNRYTDEIILNAIEGKPVTNPIT